LATPVYDEVRYTTYLTVQYCGLSGNGYDNRTESDIDLNLVGFIKSSIGC
jgi:hypothetical protein